MFKIMKKALAITLSVTLLMSTILVGGMFTVSAATDLSGTKMPTTYTFDFNDASDVPVTAFGEKLTDQFGNDFYPVHDQADDGNLSISQQDITVGESQVGALNINVPTGAFTYTPTDANGNPYIIEPNTEYKIRIKLYIVSVSSYCGLVVGGGAFGAHVGNCIIETSGYNFFASHTGTAGGGAELLTDQTAMGFYPLYKAHKNSGAFETGTRPGNYNGSPSCSGIISHWGAYAEDLTYSRVRDFTLPMKTGDFTLENGEFVDSTGDRVRPYLTIGGEGGLNYMIDSITIEKEVKVTLDANGGYFGEFDAVSPTTTATASGFAGTALSATVSHPDSSKTFVGWSLDGAIVDASVFTAAMDGKTLKAVWADESLTYTFGFDSVPEITTTSSAHGSYSTDQYGNQFHPATLYEGGDVATHTVSQETVNYNGEDLSTLKVYSSTNREFRIIPVDENGKPYIIEPNTTYTVTAKYYTKQNKGYGGFFVGGGATNIDGHATTDNWCWQEGFTTRMNFDGTITDVTGKRPMFPAYSSSINDTAWRDRDGTAEVSFETKTMTFTTEDFTATNGKFTYGSFSDTGAYFVLYMGPYTYWQNSTQDTSNKQGPQEYYFDYITITKSVSDVNVTFDANGGNFDGAETTSATLTPGEAIDVATPTQRGARFVGWSWYKNGETVDTATTGMAGQTLYAVWAPMGTTVLDANGGYFGDYAEENATVTSFVYEGDTIADYVPSHPDSSTTLVGWMLDGELIDATTVTADMVGKTLKAVWADESLTYTFGFDSVPEITTTASAHGSYSTDQYGNQFHPATLYEGGDVATHTVSKETVNYNGEDLSTLKVYSSSNREFRIIPVDENGKPYIIEPNTTYTVTAKYYTKLNAGYGGFFVGGGATNIDGHAITDNWCWQEGFTTRMTIDGVVTNVTGKRPMFPAYSSSINDTAWRDRDGTAEVSFETKTMTFTTEDFTATNGKFTYGSFSNTGAYFVLFMGPYVYWQNSSQATSNKQGPYEYYFDYITITKSVSDVTVNFDANGGNFDGESTMSADVTPGSDIEVTAPTRSGYKFAGWSWYKDAVVDANTATTGMAGKTLYAVWKSLGSATLNANGGYFGDYAAEGATVTEFIYEEASLDVSTLKHPDPSTTFVGWMLDGEMVASETVTKDMVGKTLYAVWAEEDNTYTFDFDEVKDFGLLTYDVPANASSVDQYGQTFYPFVSYSGATTTAGGNTVEYNGETVTTLRLSGIDHSMLRYIPTDANGLPYIVKPNTQYKVDVTYYAENWYATDNLYFGAGASLAYSSNIQQGTWCWLTDSAKTITRYYPDGTSETGNLNSFDEWGYHPESIGMVGRHSNGVGMGVAFNDQGQTNPAPINFKTESVYFTTSDFTQAADGSYMWDWTGGYTWKTAPYFCFSYGKSYATENSGYTRDFEIDKIVITEVKDDVTVNFDANGGNLDTTTVTLAPGSSIEVKPTHSDASYQFVGWSWYKDSYVPVKVATTGMNGATLYAHYEQKVPVTFNANGGAINGKDAVTNYYNDGDAITAPTPERKYYTFKGWAAAADSDEIVEVPATATFDLVGKTYYAVWEVAAHSGYDTFTRVVDYSSFSSSSVGNIGSSWCNTWVANDNYSYPWQSVGTDAAAGSADGYYLHYKSPQVIDGVEYVPGGWAPHYSIIMTESGQHTNTGDMTDPANLYLPENTSFRVTVRMKTLVLDGKTLNFRIGYGAAYSHANFTNVLTGVGAMNDWTDVSFVFTTPASYTEGSEQCILNIIPASTGTTLEYMIDSITLERVTATTLYTVDNGVATEANTVYGVPGTDLVLPSEVSKENYAANGTASVSRTPIAGWYADSALASAAVTKFANIDTAIYGKVEGETTTTSTINQNLYCGFDAYAMNGGVASFITNEAAYTGTYSAKAVNLTDIEVRNTNDLMLKAGKTYKVTLAYKTIDNAAITVGLSNGTSFVEEGVLELTANGEWNTATATFTADYGMNDGYALVLRAKGVYIDNIVVSSVADVIGAFTDDDTNIRFMMGYTLTGDKIVIEGVEYTITERGIAIKGEGSDKDVLTFKRDADLIENCWSYDEATGKLVFSANVNLAESFESNKIVARGYVTLSDGTTFYTDYITVSRDDVTSVDGIVGDAYAKDLYVYLPEGTVFAAEAADTATFYNLFVSGAVEVADVLENNTMKFGAYVKFSAAPEAGALTVPAEAQYLMHSGTYEQLCAGVDAYVASYKLDQVGEDAVNYVFITDLHFDNNNPEVTKQVELIANMANNDDSIDMVVVGGDITTGMFNTKEEAIAATQTAIAPLQNCTKPVIVLRGNHDDNTYGYDFDELNPAGTIVSDLDWEMNINRFVNDESVYSNFVHNTADTDSAYYYYDLVKNGKTTRVIALNACDQDLIYDEDGNVTILPVSVRSWEIENGLLKEGRNVTYGAGVSMYGYSSRQMKWLAEEALNGFDGDIIVLSHMATDGHGQGNASVTPVKNSEALNKILNAYQTKGTYNGTLYDELADVYNLETREYTAREGVAVSADFSATDGKILIYQYGHTHIEMVTYFATANIWEINTATANYVNAPKNYDDELNSMNQNYPWNIATKDERTENNDTACFDIVSAGSNVVYKFNVGFGEDVTMVLPR